MDPIFDSLGAIIALVLTLSVFSYLLGDNVLYRLAEHIFVGVSIGYAVIVAFHMVIGPKLLTPIGDAIRDQEWTRLGLLAVYLLMGLFLLLRSSRRLSWLGNLSLAVLLGVGAALAIGGALLGTLLPQISATADISSYARYGRGLGLFSGLVVLVGTSGVLLYFHFDANRDNRLAGIRNRIVQSWGGLGRWFVIVAFAAILAATFMSRLSLLIGRVQFLLDAARGLLGGIG